jgi:predicted TPR repeat methyltransferase
MKTIAAAIFFTAFAGLLLALQWHWPDRPTSLKVVKLHIEMYPGFAFSCVHPANYDEGRGNIQAAIDSYEQAMKLNLKDERLHRQLERPQAKENRR